MGAPIILALLAAGAAVLHGLIEHHADREARHD